MARKAVVTSVEDRLAAALVPAEEQPYPVPENWCWVKWGSAGDFIAGNGFKNEYQGFHDYKIPFYKVGSLKCSDANGYIYDVSNTITDKMRTELKASLIPPSSILFAKIGEAIRLKRRAINVVACCIDNNMMAFIPRYLMRYSFLWSCAIDLYQYANATTVPAIRKSDLEDIAFPLPPLAEQQRIVNRIEFLFTQLDETAEAAQAVIDGYEDRRAAILHKAFTGELTEEWRTTFGLSMETWHSYQYAELGTSKLGKMLDEKKNVGSFIPYLRNVNVRWFSFDLDDLLQMKASEEEIAKLSVEDGDLFICEGGEPGRCAVWENGKCELIFQKAIHRFRPNGIAETHFLAYYIFFYTLNGTLQQYFTGTTIKHLTGQSLAKIDFIIPSIAEQHEIVRRLDSLLSSESATKAAAEATLEQITTLRQSILARAFRGELGTGDPTDEPAIELLRRTLQTT